MTTIEELPTEIKPQYCKVRKAIGYNGYFSYSIAIPINFARLMNLETSDNLKVTLTDDLKHLIIKRAD